MVWNTMVKQTLVLVLSIIGVLYFGGVGAFVYVGLTMSAQSAIAPSMSFYLTLIGPAVFIGWILLPVLFGALDNTLAPDRLSPYVGPTRRLGVGLVAVGALHGQGGGGRRGVDECHGCIRFFGAALPLLAWAHHCGGD